MIDRNVFVNVQVRSTTADGQGQDIETWSNLHVAVPGRLDEPRGRSSASKDSILYEADSILFLDKRFLVLDEAEHRVVIGPTIYKILSVNDPGGTGYHAELLLQVVR